MKTSRRVTIGVIVTVAAGGLFHLGRANAGGVVTGAESNMIALSLTDDATLFRDITGEYRVRCARVVITGTGFLPGGGTVQDKNGTKEVSRYALRFDDVPFPMSDLKLADKTGTRLSGILQIPLQLLTETEIKKPRSFRIYDRIEGAFIPTAPKKSTTIRFSMSATAPSFP